MICMLATLTLLIFDRPLLASMTLVLMINFEASYVFYTPILLAYSMASIIKGSPSQYIVKQVDYIVWKVIFLLLNLLLINLAIWWPLVTVEKGKAKDENTAGGRFSIFDFTQAKALLAD